MPKSIIPTKGQRGPEIEKFYEDFDLKYTSGRRYCGIYIPTMNTAFDPKSGSFSNSGPSLDESEFFCLKTLLSRRFVPKICFSRTFGLCSDNGSDRTYT